ncbi:hypothetical protein [Nodularia chucula]|uniref:hypothetical protein n=1 Tax=Nodularia chucula TaxID=3093667 RepID=UPI0039C750B2
MTKFKTITYKRILNLGNYESKHLEATIEIPEGITALGAEVACSELMDFVESKIREDHFKSMNEEITKIESHIKHLRKTRKIVESLTESDNNPGEGGDF